jgi:hypothetical protein
MIGHPIASSEKAGELSPIVIGRPINYLTETFSSRSRQNSCPTQHQSDEEHPMAPRWERLSGRLIRLRRRHQGWRRNRTAST